MKLKEWYELDAEEMLLAMKNNIEVYHVIVDDIIDTYGELLSCEELISLNKLSIEEIVSYYNDDFYNYLSMYDLFFDANDNFKSYNTYELEELGIEL